ncbi:hypothetical protein KL918_003693 [Ogataea parapolymorpha]|uniref:Uncharacterized protein n=1 Tax=Ogataea parapolymorpha (strain ATCC 26012 / BCRC 20466 / JCM 22074 / NRRL Y-7560 / DL-1) TaxID=871575 RepID=W1QIM8_OGAPD|nr:hypothetical protein HPODL_04909 [Ogataea parapolymorpha DL-1]ESX02149.1 hypothetical protein HPODL_04909 [Ogataea parapolymorpha DL-1]KAG7866228.1 hypothetical protein KL918_003693 [Ogataea parapolymorpha]KAG7871361.1 hypothetical protein KL916_004156 [Ogataea parapolymorpha]
MSIFSDDVLLTRSRSNSESQFKSTRAEKRLGRLFKPPSTTSSTPKPGPSSANSSTASIGSSVPSASGKSEPKQLALEDLKYHVGRNLRSMSQSAIPTSSSMTGQNGGLSASALPRKPSLASQTAGTDGKLTTLREVHGSTASERLAFSDTMKMAHKVRFVYSEFTGVLKNLGISINTSTNSFNNFVSLYDFLNRRANDTDRDAIQESLRTQLATQLVELLKDLRKIVDHLTFPSHMVASLGTETIRMAYFSLFSLLVELTSICKILDPSFTPRTQQKSSRPTQLSAAPLAPQKLRTQPPKINRAPPPNPQHAQTIPVPQRQPSVHRQPLKVDTSLPAVARQDSELSAISNIESTTDNEKLYDIISFTTQAAHAVFTQLNDALAKSAISTAQNTQNSQISQDGGPDNQDLPNIAQKVKELTTYCMSSMEQTKRIKTVLNQTRSAQRLDEDQQKRLYEETNLFLKSIISFLAATKGALQDMPALNEVRGALSNLTRATKELTIRLETSVLKQSVTNATDQPPLSSIPSVANFQNGHFGQEATARTVPSPLQSEKEDSMQQQVKSLQTSGLEHVAQLPVTTPLVASIGPTAASVVLPVASPMGVNVNPPEYNPFDKLSDADAKRVT